MSTTINDRNKRLLFIQNQYNLIPERFKKNSDERLLAWANKLISLPDLFKIFIQVHGKKYDYSKVEEDFVNTSSKIKIICPKHGLFIQQAIRHASGNGCQGCFDERRGGKLSIEDHIKEMKAVHNGIYDYSKAEEDFVDTSSKIKIICKKHGIFRQILSDHKFGRGCSKCNRNGKHFLKPLDFVLKELELVHKGKYDYSLVKQKYVNSKSVVDIICKEHGVFQQVISEHKYGKGCILCSRKPISLEETLKELELVHKGKYDYSLVKQKYVNSKSVVDIICKEHGVFQQVITAHKQGQGCKNCSKTGPKPKFKNTKSKKDIQGPPLNLDLKPCENSDEKTNIFIKNAKKLHGNKYDYSKVIFTHSKVKVEIVCNNHGSFWQTPNSHLRSGCYKCGKEKAGKTHMYTQEIITEDFRRVHGKKYDYSKVVYVKSSIKVEIICHKHGSFFQTPNNHLRGANCKQCSMEIRKKPA